jgi:hypothetical protein
LPPYYRIFKARPLFLTYILFKVKLPLLFLAEKSESTPSESNPKGKNMRNRDAYIKKMKAKPDELQNSSKEAWEDCQAGLDSAWKSLGNAVNSALSRSK